MEQCTLKIVHTGIYAMYRPVNSAFFSPRRCIKCPQKMTTQTRVCLLLYRDCFMSYSTGRQCVHLPQNLIVWMQYMYVVVAHELHLVNLFGVSSLFPPSLPAVISLLEQKSSRSRLGAFTVGPGFAIIAVVALKRQTLEHNHCYALRIHIIKYAIHFQNPEMQ